jgi:regulator of sigma E protease
MIVIHEFGHFIVAKALGIAVETFSVGFGPRLLGFKIGDTDYRLSAIPLGGYVKFRGENMELMQGKSEGSVDEFLSQPKWKRFLVALAGPIFNLVTALLIPTAAIMIGFQADIYDSQQVVIGEVTPGSTAEQSGLQKGDRIIAFKG